MVPYSGTHVAPTYSTVSGFSTMTLATATWGLWDWPESKPEIKRVVLAPPKNWRWFHCYRQAVEPTLPEGILRSVWLRRFTKTCRRDRRANKRKTYLMSL